MREIFFSSIRDRQDDDDDEEEKDTFDEIISSNDILAIQLYDYPIIVHLLEIEAAKDVYFFPFS